MGRRLKSAFLRKIAETSPKSLKTPALAELVRVYEDLEKTLSELKRTCERAMGAETSLSYINVKKLIGQLMRTKRKLERKIGNTILLERQQLKRRIRSISSLASREV
jgi:hypothetical protein